MARKLLMTAAVVALGTGTAFAQTQTGQQQTQQPAAGTGQQQVQQPTVGTGQQPAAQTQAQAPVGGQVATGECADRMRELSGGEFFTGEAGAYRQHIGVLSSLRDSAMQLQAQGLDDACMQVVDAMETAIASFEGAGAGAAATGGTMGGLATRGEVTREQLEQRLVPIDSSDMAINTARLQGTDLYSMEGDDIGDVEGFLMAQGRPTHMIVSHGGFWNIGSDDVAIPLDIVRWDPEWQTFFAPLTSDQLDQAPDYDENAWNAGANDQFYQAFRG